ncbi:lysophospholipase [Pseudomonadales bacterium]|nr:lysophospholipase [Pseudomonadales bacterium]
MSLDTLTFTASDNHPVHCYYSLPAAKPRGIIHIAHGMGEHGGRYEWTAQQLNAAGYAVYINDHRGHGETATVLGDFGIDGWNRTLLDLHEMNQQYAKDYPGVPRILFGHSMGSMLTEQYIERYGASLDGVIISGSPGFAHPLLSWLVRQICRFEAWRLGPLQESPILQQLVFGNANKAFAAATPEPTGFEWLSRDSAQVRAYMDDPLCGFVPFPASLLDIFKGAAWTQTQQQVEKIPANLPLYLFSGSDDPVHNQMADLNRLLKQYAKADLQIETTFYPEGRHEMLNAPNRDEVMDDVLRWLDRLFPAKQSGASEA